MSVDGTACFEPMAGSSGNVFQYTEEGVLEKTDGSRCSVTQRYVYKYQDDKINVYFDGHPPDRLLHSLDFINTSLATGHHLCINDTYDATYEFLSPEAFKLTYSDANYTSGEIKSQDKLAVTYGRIEAMMMLPHGQGIWPAFWIMPNVFDCATYREIDIMENIGLDWTIYSTYHYGNVCTTWDNLPKQYNDTTVPTASSDYHLYSVIWEENLIVIFNDPSPETDAGLFSRFTYSWASETVKRGAKRPLELTDIPDIILNDIGYCYTISFETNRGSDTPSHYGWLWFFAMFLSAAINALSLQHEYWYVVLMSLEIRGALMSLVFRKMLRLNNTSRRAYAGKIMNLVSVDVENIHEYFWNGFIDIVAQPIQILLLLALLCIVIGWSGLLGFAVMGLSTPLSTYIITKSNVHYLESLIFSDQRVKLIGEFISGIRFLKLYNWENSFIDRITGQRNKQLVSSRRRLILWAMDRTVAQMTTGLVLLVTFLTYTLTGNTLTAATAFPAVTIFLALRKPLQMAPEAFQRLLVSISSCDRLEEYFNSSESSSYNDLAGGSDRADASRVATDIVIENGEFDWNDDRDVANTEVVTSPKDDITSSLTASDSLAVSMDEMTAAQQTSVLKNINFLAPAGKLTVIVGRVGEGKTSLVSALIGEIRCVNGTIQVPPTIGYTPQIAWLVNGTLRENILFGAPYDAERYAAVIEACCLKPDLVHLPAKDLTELGERGVNLSGGQKQRISLARCLYGDADAYILDEPLSAVDAEVGKHLFDHCIQGMMSNRTRILVTHQLQFIPSADHIVVMEGGALIQGTYDELQSRGIDFESIMKTKIIDVDQPAKTDSMAKNSLSNSHVISMADCIVMDTGDVTDELVQKSKLFVSEERNKGVIGAETYIPYFRSGGPTILYIAVILVFFFSQLVFSASDYWLVIWTQNSLQPQRGPNFYLIVYAGFIAAFGVLITIRHLGISYLTWKASKVLHERLLNSVFFSPCSFFDQNPSGRILNRFSKDISDIDNRLVPAMADVLYCGSSVIVSLAMVVFLTPLVVIPFFVLQAFQGLNSIRVFKQQDRFIEEMDKRLDLNQRLFYHSFSVNRWLGLRMELLTSCVVLMTGIFALLATNITPARAGMAVSSALSVTGILNWAIRQFTDLEVRMNSVERVLAYVNSPSEGERDIEANRPPAGWPHAGQIEFRNLEVKYRPTMEPSLCGLTATIPPCSKVGIVGRTGAGKSTIGISLFRMIEASAGSIIID
eukprot:gene11567-13500_t